MVLLDVCTLLKGGPRQVGLRHTSPQLIAPSASHQSKLVKCLHGHLHHVIAIEPTSRRKTLPACFSFSTCILDAPQAPLGSAISP